MAYTRIDRLIAKLRFRAAYPHIRKGSRVCDLGCGLEAAFLNYAAERIVFGAGVDDQLEEGVRSRWERVRTDLCTPLPFPAGHFDHVVMLAVLEHLTNPEPVLREAQRLLVPGGSLIMTWPASTVDPILGVMRRLHLISGEMESDKHQKRIPVKKLREMLERIGFHNFIHKRFELGLNNLVVATKE